MPPAYWLIKSEPFKYPWDALVKDGATYWDGVRNYEARNNLQAMKVGDLALFYHSNEGKEVVGIARVKGEHYPDPTIDDDTWCVVDFEPLRPMVETVTLAEFKEDPLLSQSALVKRGRISVIPITPEEFARVLAMGRTKLDGPVEWVTPPSKDPKIGRSARRREIEAQKAGGGAAKKVAGKKKAGAKSAAARKKAAARSSAAAGKKASAQKAAAKKKAVAKRKAAAGKAARKTARKNTRRK